MQESLAVADLLITPVGLQELGNAIGEIHIYSDRYTAEEQWRVEK